MTTPTPSGPSFFGRLFGTGNVPPTPPTGQEPSKKEDEIKAKTAAAAAAAKGASAVSAAKDAGPTLPEPPKFKVFTATYISEEANKTLCDRAEQAMQRIVIDPERYLDGGAARRFNEQMAKLPRGSKMTIILVDSASYGSYVNQAVDTMIDDGQIPRHTTGYSDVFVMCDSSTNMNSSGRPELRGDFIYTGVQQRANYFRYSRSVIDQAANDNLEEVKKTKMAKLREEASQKTTSAASGRLAPTSTAATAGPAAKKTAAAAAAAKEVAGASAVKEAGPALHPPFRVFSATPLTDERNDTFLKLAQSAMEKIILAPPRYLTPSDAKEFRKQMDALPPGRNIAVFVVDEESSGDEVERHISRMIKEGDMPSNAGGIRDVFMMCDPNTNYNTTMSGKPSIVGTSIYDSTHSRARYFALTKRRMEEIAKDNVDLGELRRARALQVSEEAKKKAAAPTPAPTAPTAATTRSATTATPTPTPTTATSRPTTAAPTPTPTTARTTTATPTPAPTAATAATTRTTTTAIEYQRAQLEAALKHAQIVNIGSDADARERLINALLRYNSFVGQKDLHE